MKRSVGGLICTILLLAGAHGATAADLDFEIVNTTHNIYFTPILISAHVADLGRLAVGEIQTWDLATYDAGTEANSEAAATIPGPAGGGQGYSSVRDDRDYVAVHPGVVTSDDGLAGSALNESHRFLNPTVRLLVTRVE